MTLIRLRSYSLPLFIVYVIKSCVDSLIHKNKTTSPQFYNHQPPGGGGGVLRICMLVGVCPGTPKGRGEQPKKGVLCVGTARKMGVLGAGHVKKGGSLPRHIPILKIYVCAPPPPAPTRSNDNNLPITQYKELSNIGTWTCWDLYL